MKKPIMMLVLTLVLIACKKDEKESNVSIIGVWTPLKKTYIETKYENNIVVDIDTIIFVGQPGEFLKVNSDGTFEMKNIKASSDQDGNVWYEDEFDVTEGTYSATYGSFSPSTGKINLDDGSGAKDIDIVLLTSNKLEMSYTEVFVNTGTRKETTKGILEYKK